ncbi:MAG: hypothetical protein J7513_04210 [Solirubrobacteraceae bacterium]|nr:hypothetical protein [Solirubrobacteraceae bacterium]
MRRDAPTSHGLATRSLADLAREAFPAAEAAAGDHAPIRLRIGNHRIAVRFDGPASTGAVLPAWRSLLADAAPDDTVDAEVFIVTSDRSGPPPSTGPVTAGRRDHMAVGDDRFMVEVRADGAGLSIWDTDQRRGLWWSASAEAIGVNDRLLPLGAVLPALLRSLGLVPVRAAVVGSARGGLLIAGDLRSGRTTTALAARRLGMPTIADAIVAVDPATRVAHPLTGFAAASTTTLQLMPELAARLAQLPPTPDGKQAVLLDTRPLREPEGMPLRALVVPTRSDATGAPVRDADPAATRATAAASWLRCAGSLPVDERRLSEVVHDLPVFELPVGPDPDSVAAGLAQILRGLDA